MADERPFLEQTTMSDTPNPCGTSGPMGKWTANRRLN